MNKEEEEEEEIFLLERDVYETLSINAQAMFKLMEMKGKAKLVDYEL